MKIVDILKLLTEGKNINQIAKQNKIEITKLKDKLLKLANKIETYQKNQKDNSVKVYSDGAVSGNPGIGGIGCVVYDTKGNKLAAKNEYIGHTTNNIAEYRALLLGLNLALQFSPNKIKFYADSELMVKQIKKEYKISNLQLKDCFLEFYKKIGNIPFSITHIKRNLNKEADELAVMAKSKKIL